MFHPSTLTYWVVVTLTTRTLQVYTHVHLAFNCHASDGRKSTPLHLAAGYNRTRIFQLLLSHGADVHAKDKGGLVPLHNACSYGHFEVAELLLKHGANVNAMDLWQVRLQNTFILLILLANFYGEAV